MRSPACGHIHTAFKKTEAPSLQTAVTPHSASDERLNPSVFHQPLRSDSIVRVSLSIRLPTTAARSMSGALHRRRRAIALFRACLRSAARCPRGEHADQMRSLTRLKFRDAQSVRDAGRVDALMEDGLRELASLEYMHEVRERRGAAATFDDVLTRVRDAVTASAARPVARARVAATGEPPRAAPCASCGAALASSNARFCSECGARVIQLM